MHYIVFDLEWNQALSRQSQITGRLPFPLAGEVIQIGAVRLDAKGCVLDEFKVNVRPEYFTKIHYKVKKLTGISREQMRKGINFVSAIIRFMAWCGEDYVVLTWGRDDIRILRQNLRLHGMNAEWPERWMDLQLIYNIQTGGDKNQKALSSAMEHFGIEATRPIHDALGDAYHTALICGRLDMEKGKSDHDEYLEKLRESAAARKERAEKRPTPISRAVFAGYETRSLAFSDNAMATTPCPHCGEALVNRRWLSQDKLRYITAASCPEHGVFYLRLRFRREDDRSLTVTRLIFPPSPEIESVYEGRVAARKRNK